MASSRTVSNLVESALRAIGVLASGETASTDDTATGLELLQDLIGELASDGLTVPFLTQEAITLVAQQTSYTVGENGTPDLETVRPEIIVGAFVRNANDYDWPVAVITEAAYRSIATKSESYGRPTRLYYSPTVPNGTVYVWPSPNDAEELYIVSAKQMTEPDALSDDVLNTTGIPRNYYNPLKWLLVIELGIEYGRETNAVMAARASKGYNDIVALNAIRRVSPSFSDVSYFGRGGIGYENAGISAGDYITFGGDVVLF